MNSKAELPIYSQSLDGNSSDKKTLQKTIESVIKFQENIDCILITFENEAK